MNLFSILELAAKKWPEETAVIHSDRSFRYSELHHGAESLASGLCKAGVRAGDKIGLMCPTGPEYIVGFFAVLRVGGIAVSISPAFKAAEICDLANEMGLDGFCYSDQFKAVIPEGVRSTASKVFVFGDRHPLWVQLNTDHEIRPGEREQLMEMNTACIHWSSGTASKAKGIVLSHATVLVGVETHCHEPPISHSDTVLWVQSMEGGFPQAIGAYLLQGAKIIIGNATDTQKAGLLFKQHNISLVQGIPLFYRLMLNQDDITADCLRRVRHFITTGTALPRVVAEAFRAKFDREIIEHYGLRECGKVLANFNEGINKRGSVGTPVGGYKVMLALGNPGQSEEGPIGELLVHGPGLFEAYYMPWRLRDEVLEDRWFRTGDVARRDADGYYWIVGRTKEVINVGGVKVFPQELEEILLSHPAVEEAVVYGVAEGRFGEVPHAKVKLRAGATCTEREIMRHVNEKVSLFKSLRGVELVAEIPKTVTGKPRRTVVES